MLPSQKITIKVFLHKDILLKINRVMCVITLTYIHLKTFDANIIPHLDDTFKEHFVLFDESILCR